VKSEIILRLLNKMKMERKMRQKAIFVLVVNILSVSGTGTYYQQLYQQQGQLALGSFQQPQIHQQVSLLFIPGLFFLLNNAK
jgi:hypothetical protein